MSSFETFIWGFVLGTILGPTLTLLTKATALILVNAWKNYR